jgi:hypothetical protein
VLDDAKLRAMVQVANERKAAAEQAIRRATNAYLLKAQQEFPQNFSALPAKGQLHL